MDDIEQEKIEKALRAFLALFFTFALLIPFQTFVFLKGWNWFINPLFNLPILEFWQAFGVWTLARFVASFKVGVAKAEDSTPLKDTMGALVYSAIVLGFLYLGSLLMIR